jgi:hypothetical protein
MPARLRRLERLERAAERTPEIAARVGSPQDQRR